ncbi:unnamed protein product [Durusdinium trenchii]|uniref:Uncharacterized protein n=1 Tax=Durusdinium trenchii TaxID=1381693 RepID=A0ABP0HI96_9DINO
MPKCEVGHFQNRLESSLKMCLDNVKRACDGADIESLPRTHQFIRWQSKIRAWSSIKPDLSQQMDSFLQGYIDQAIGGASKHPDELHAHVLLVARLENISDIATQMPGFGDAAKIDGALKDAEECLEKHFEHIFESASQAANASVRAVLESPESDSVDFVVLKTVGKELKESRSAWESGLEAASKTHARVVKWYERLQGAATGWLDSLQECNKEMLDTVGVIAAGGNKSDVDLATGACCKNLYYTMSELVDSLPDVDRQNCMKSTCDVVLLDTLNCFNGVSSAALTLSTQVVNGSATQSILQSLRVLIEVLQGFAWMDIAKDADAPNSTLDKLQKQVQEYSDELYRSLCTLLRTFLETSPVKRSLSKFLRAWKEFQGLSELIPVFQFLEDEQASVPPWLLNPHCTISTPFRQKMSTISFTPMTSYGVQKSADDIKMLVFSCVDAPGNYKDLQLRELFLFLSQDVAPNHKKQRRFTNCQEKDFVLCTLEKWRGLMLLSLLKMFGPEEQVHEQVKREVLDDLGKVRDMIGNPTERQSAADTLVKLALLELKSSAFNEAQRLWQQYQCLLTTRNFEDDQTIQLQLEDFDFTGLKDLLGERPEKESAESTLSKTFHLRLGRIESTVRERLSLAKRSVHEPEIFAREFRKLKAADAELGDYLKLYKEMDLRAEVEKVGVHGAEHFQLLLVKIKAELEEKNYDACLNHADELQCLVSKWEGVDILTRTQLSEAEVALKKAKNCLELVKPLATNFLEIVKHIDEKALSTELILELKQLQIGHRPDVKEAYNAAVQRIAKDLNGCLHDVNNIGNPNSYEFGIAAFELLKRHFDGGLGEHFPQARAQVEQDLMKLKQEVELHNEQILSNLYSDEKKIEQLRLELDKLSSKHQSPEWWESTWESTLQFFGGTSRKSADAARAADYARKNYCALQARVNKEIIDHIEEGLNGMQAGHFDVSGSVVSFLELVSSHLSSHLDGSTQGQIERFEGEVKNMFQNRLEKLLKSFDGEDARTAIAELGDWNMFGFLAPPLLLRL